MSAVLGAVPMAALGLHAVVGAATVVLMAMLARETLPSARARAIAVGLTLTFGPFYMYEVLVLKTTVAVAVTTAALFLLVVSVRRRSARLMLVSHLTFGLPCLLRGNSLGGMYLRLGTLDAARVCFERVAAGAPDQPELRFNLAGVLAQQGEHCAAAEQLGVAATSLRKSRLETSPAVSGS